MFARIRSELGEMVAVESSRLGLSCRNRSLSSLQVLMQASSGLLSALSPLVWDFSNFFDVYLRMAGG